MFPPLLISFEYWLNMLPSDFFVLCLDSTGEFQALQLIVHASFGAVYYTHASCMSTFF